MLPQDTIDQAKTDRGAFYDAVDFEMMGVLRDCKERLDAQCYDDGTGKLPYYLLYDGATGGTHVPSCLQVNGTNVLLNGSHYYHVGKRVSVYNAGYTIHHTRAAKFNAARRTSHQRPCGSVRLYLTKYTTAAAARNPEKTKKNQYTASGKITLNAPNTPQ